MVKRAGAYIQSHDPNFSWNVLQKIEEETIENKEGRVMSLFQQTVDEACQKAQQKGLQEGWQKGIKKGMEKGMEKGIEKGQAEGMEKGQQQLILKLLERGMDLQSICKYTGFSENEINKLKNRSN